jgi:hypothetical protein
MNISVFLSIQKPSVGYYAILSTGRSEHHSQTISYQVTSELILYSSQDERYSLLKDSSDSLMFSGKSDIAKNPK